MMFPSQVKHDVSLDIKNLFQLTIETFHMCRIITGTASCTKISG